MVKDIEHITAEIKDFYQSVASSYPIKAVFLYGSWAENRAHEDSDIDIGIIVDDKSIRQAHFDLYSKGKDWDIDFDVLVFPERDFLSEDPPVIHEMKTKGIRIV